MSHKKKWKGRAHDASADAAFESALLGEDSLSRRSFNAREDRKTQQLCQQVRRAIMLALAGECDDDVLRDVYVESVEPIGNSAQLLVRVAVPAWIDPPSWEVMARLNARGPRLRALVAHSICRKRVPGLSFLPIPQQPESSEGEK